MKNDLLVPTPRTTHKYFEVKYFDQLEALHEDAKKYLEFIQPSLDLDPDQEARIRRHDVSCSDCKKSPTK